MNLDRLSPRARLVVRLLENTRKQKVRWQETVKDNIFEVSLPEYSLQISKGEYFDDSKGAEPIELYTVQIYNEEGKLIDEFNDEQITLEPHPELNINAFVAMQEIYERARGFVLGSDRAISEIIEFLESDELPF